MDSNIKRRNDALMAAQYQLDNKDFLVLIKEINNVYTIDQVVYDFSLGKCVLKFYNHPTKDGLSNVEVKLNDFLLFINKKVFTMSFENFHSTYEILNEKDK